MRMVRKSYNEEFRKEAVRLASEPGTTASVIERDLGYYQGNLSS